MRHIEATLKTPARLSVALIERSGILPDTTRYFSEPMPYLGSSRVVRRTERQAWFERAREAVGGCKLLFLDPDNGFAVSSVHPGSRRFGKYAAAYEVAELLHDATVVVVYQHRNRWPWAVQREHVLERLRLASRHPAAVRTLRFGDRAFFCASTTARGEQLINDALALLAERVRESPVARHLQME